MDGFSFGKPGKGRPLRTSRRPSAGRAIPEVRKPVMVVAGVVLAAALAFGLFQVVKSGGEAVADNTATDLHQADAARDADAQATVRNAQLAAKVTFTESNTYAETTPDALTKIEPSFQYVSGASTGPSIVSVATTPTEVGLAVMSQTGTCFYVHLDEVNADAYGSGKQCTGSAALSAASPSF